MDRPPRTGYGKWIPFTIGSVRGTICDGDTTVPAGWRDLKSRGCEGPVRNACSVLTPGYAGRGRYSVRTGYSLPSADSGRPGDHFYTGYVPWIRQGPLKNCRLDTAACRGRHRKHRA